jgi:uncharacterized membrane-anchored protein
MRQNFAAALAALLTLATGLAAQEADPGMTLEEFEASLTYQHGEVILGDGLATIQVPEGFGLLGPDDGERLLVDGWGNPPGEKPLGVLVPDDVSPFSDDGWAVVLSFEDDGYVEDDEAASLDYDELLEDMQDGAREENEWRRENGYATVELAGWATEPHYDPTTNKLYWAQDLVFGDGAEHTLNYDIRMLGRRGVLVLTAVSSMGQLPRIETGMQSVMASVDFNEGHRYSDFDPGVDKIAAYGIGALVAGKVAAKAGIFKLLLGLLVAAKKLVVVVAIAAVAMVKRLFGRGGAEAAEV